MDLMSIINRCGKDGYPKFKVKETALESEGVAQICILSHMIRINSQIGLTDAKF